MISWIRYIAKAIAAAVVAGGGAVLVAIGDSSDAGSTITLGEWVTVVVATLVAGFGVYAVANTAEGVRRFSKAIVAGATAFGGTFAVAMTEGLTTAAWTSIAIATVLAVLSVYGLANGTKPVTS